MSAFNTPRTSPTRVSSRKTATPSPVSVPVPRLVSPRRTRARHMRADLHCGLYAVNEGDEYDEPSRCPSLYYNAPPSPGTETHRSSLVYTPNYDDDDPFEDCTFSPISDTFYDDAATKAPRALRSPIRTAMAPVRPRTTIAAPYPQRVLLPALPILAPCEQRPVSPSPPTPRSPITPTTPTFDGMGANLVSALRGLLTSCGDYEYKDDMFADAVPVPGQFDDAVSPKPSPSPLAQPVQAFCPVPVVAPRTPPPKHAPCTEELLRAPRKTRGPREPLAPGLNGDHSFLASMAAEARADRLAAEAEAFEDLAPALPSLSSSSSISSASSLNSLCGMTSGMTMTPRPPVTPPRKAVVSSRRILRSPLAVWS